MGNTCGDDLPLLSKDVLIQILVWLPVISLLRFKSVCKSWHALIESSFFIDLHTTATTFNSSPSPKLGTFILQAFEYSKFSNCFSMDIEKKMFMLSSGSGGGGGGVGGSSGSEDDDLVVFKVDNLGFPPCSKDSLMSHSILMVGSCNGLICLLDSDVDDVSLWNPATRQFRILPKSITIEEERVGIFLSKFVAFGFDVKTKDYKVVWINSYTTRGAPRGEGCICRVQVYSLCTNSWRLLEGILHLPAIPRSFVNHGIYLNGSYFFEGQKCITRQSYRADGSIIPISNCCLIFSFDFTKEIFTTMQFPDHDSRHRLAISYLGEKIAVFTVRTSSLSDFLPDRNSDGYDYYDMWVLNEHGSMNNESWTKLHSFRIESRSVLTQPMCILNNGEFALIRNKDGNQLNTLELFNLLTKEVEKDFTIGDGVLTKKVEKDITIADGVLRADFYQQSLVSITAGSGAAATSG